MLKPRPRLLGAAWGSRIAAEVGLAATFGAGIAPTRVSSSFHCAKLRVGLATNGEGAVLPAFAECAALAVLAGVSPRAAADGWKSIWTAFACARVASVFAASGYFIRLVIWLGTYSPCRVSSVRIVLSVIDPEPSCPAIGMPLTSEISTAPPVSLSLAEKRAEQRRTGWVHDAVPALSASDRCARGMRAPPARACRSPPMRPRGGRGHLGLCLDQRAPPARAGSWRAGTRRSRWPRAGRSAPWPPADAAPRRAPSSSRAPAGDRSSRCRPRAGPRSADGRLSPRVARARDRAPCPRRRAIHAAAAHRARSPWPALTW